MLRGLFGENKKDALVRAKEEFEAVCRLQGNAREVRVARIRMGIRCRAVIDETFLEGIEKCAEHLEQCMVAVITGDPRPPLPKAGAFQKIKTINGPAMAYIPLEEAEEVFSIGGLYQREQISDAQALELVQQVAHRISALLQLDRPIEPLEFLSEKLEEDRAAQDLAAIRAAKQQESS
ncbi:MAG: hypothetical protein RLZZ344_1315 [Pseudomonadota bacterium]|jgi:hypothetical protein